jgi:plastocyanin
MTRCGRLIAALSLLALAATTPAARASDSAIAIQSFAFAPSTLSVSTGTTVTWTNLDPFSHTTTSDSTAWDSGTLEGGASFSIEFIAAGTYAYHCAVHPSMRGTVTVTGSPLPPSPPADLVATPGTSVGSIALHWTAPRVVGVSGYAIYRGTAPGAETFVASVSSSAFTDEGLAPLTTYFYEVAALNGGLASGRSGEACSRPFPWVAGLGCGDLVPS